jgi:hypothetical protein
MARKGCIKEVGTGSTMERRERHAMGGGCGTMAVVGIMTLVRARCTKICGGCGGGTPLDHDEFRLHFRGN